MCLSYCLLGVCVCVYVCMHARVCVIRSNAVYRFLKPPNAHMRTSRCTSALGLFACMGSAYRGRIYGSKSAGQCWPAHMGPASCCMLLPQQLRPGRTRHVHFQIIILCLVSLLFEVSWVQKSVYCTQSIPIRQPVRTVRKHPQYSG